MKELLLGNEAVARGLYEAGVRVVSSYPGTPSTETIDKGLSQAQDRITVGWSVNEAVAVSVGVGHAMAGRDCVVTMKVPGLYQACDAFTSVSCYMQPKGALIYYIASDFTPSSTQHVIDPRYLFKSCFVPVFEPRTHQEMHEAAGLAADISRTHRTPVVILAGGLLCWCLLPFCGFFSGVLSNNGAIANDVARYAFFTLLSSPFVGVNLVLSSFAILDDRSKLAMGSVVAANGVNIVLDVVFMKYLRTGVAGAAAASLLGNAAGILVVLPYLLSKKRTFRFVLRADDLRETGRELASSCSSFATDKASRIFSGLTVNLLLMYFVGNIGVALYAVYSQLRFILRILAGGALQTISTLGSMLYGERDFYGLRKMLSLLSKYTYALVAALMAGLFCFSAPFLNSYGIAAEPDTVLSLRIMLLSLPFLWLNDLLARLYPSVQRQRLSVLLLTLQNVVLKILLLLLCVAAISRLHWRSVPAVAVWCLLVELLSPAVTLLREKRTCGNVALLGLEDQADRSCHTFSITGKAENVADIHREIDLFCQQNGISRNKGVLLAIAFEEAALNIINHNEHVSMIDICLLLEEGSLIVRIRDDGAPFDPLAFVDDEDILQMNNIRLLERLTDQKTYTRIMNMNNTVLSIRLEAAENDGANDGTC